MLELNELLEGVSHLLTPKGAKEERPWSRLVAKGKKKQNKQQQQEEGVTKSKIFLSLTLSGMGKFD